MISPIRGLFFPRCDRYQPAFSIHMQRKRPADLSATWHEPSHAIMLRWACWKRIRLDWRQTCRRLGFLASCSNLAPHGGIQMGQTQIWQRRRPEANHVKAGTTCQVALPPLHLSVFQALCHSRGWQRGLIIHRANKGSITVTGSLGRNSLCTTKKV